MASSSLGLAWCIMKIITGIQNTREGTNVTLNCFSSIIDFDNALNCFYNQFDMFDFRKEKQEIKLEQFDQHFSISQQDVEKAFFCTKVNKTQGPDNTCGQLLKTCAKELSQVFYSIFTGSIEV